MKATVRKRFGAAIVSLTITTSCYAQTSTNARDLDCYITSYKAVLAAPQPNSADKFYAVVGGTRATGTGVTIYPYVLSAANQRFTLKKFYDDATKQTSYQIIDQNSKNCLWYRGPLSLGTRVTIESCSNDRSWVLRRTLQLPNSSIYAYHAAPRTNTSMTLATSYGRVDTNTPVILWNWVASLDQQTVFFCTYFGQAVFVAP